MIAPSAVLYSLAVLLGLVSALSGYRFVAISQADVADYNKMADRNKSRWSGLALKLSNHTRVVDMTADMAEAVGPMRRVG